MARFVVLLVLGAIGGAAAVWLARGAGESGAEIGGATAENAATAALPDPGTARAGAPPGNDFAADRLAVLEQALAIDDTFDLEGLIRNAARQPRSRLRDMRLEALLARHAELDPAAAFAFAQNLLLDARLVLPVFEAWIAADADAAIGELAFVQPPGRQRELALAALGIVGNDAEDLERVAAALPESARLGFEMDALVARARDEPMAALQAVLALEPNALQSYALNRIARLAAERDPRGALALIEGIDDRSVRSTAVNAALGAWADSDPDAVFAWLGNAAVSRLPESAIVFRTLAQNDPERLVAMAGGWSGEARTNALRWSLQAIGERDAEAALALLNTMPPSSNRDSLLATIGQSYGRQHPDEALAWVESLGTGPSYQTVRASVIRGVAEVDIDRALDLVVADIEASGAGLPGLVSVSSLSTMLTLSTLGSGADAERVIDRLAGINSPAANSAVSNAMVRWAQTDAEAALNWALRNAGRVDGAALSGLARQIAGTDVALAMATLSQFPPAQRAGWLEGMVTGVAARDVNEALSLLNSFQGQPGFSQAYGAVANQMARSDPAAAARMLSAAPAGSAAALASAMALTAANWSRSDPAAASAWAATLTDSRAQAQSLTTAARSWADTDPNAAREWMLGLGRGPARDAALSGYLSSAARRGEFDPLLLADFSQPGQAQQAAMTAIATLGQSDVERARALAAAHVTDPAMRRTLEEMLARAGGAGSTRTITSGGVVIVQ